MHRFFTILILFTVSLIVIGCNSGEDEEPQVPTIAVFFSGDAVPTQRPTALPSPTSPPQPTPLPTPDIIYNTLSIFDEETGEDWYLDADRMEYELVSDWTYSGETAVRVVPQDNFAAFLILLDESISQPHLRDYVYGFSFYLSGGPSSISNTDFIVAAQGSNEYPYWVSGDQSARVDGGPIFSETQLVFLELNNAIPPDTWVKIEVPLNDLLFDPPYTYFTGFYIKNGSRVSDVFYIDQIELITIEIANEKERLVATSTPTSASVSEPESTSTPLAPLSPTAEESGSE